MPICKCFLGLGQQELLFVPDEFRNTFAQTIPDGKDATKCDCPGHNRLCGLCHGHQCPDQMLCLVVCNGFSSDALGMPFDGYKCFGEKADSAVENFNNSNITACFLGLLSLTHQFHQQYKKVRRYLWGLAYHQRHPSQLVQQVSQFCFML